MYVYRNIAVISANHCCSGKAKMHSLCVLGLYDSVSYTKVMPVFKESTYGNFMCR
jgi:hypothetical protein